MKTWMSFASLAIVAVAISAMPGCGSGSNDTTSQVSPAQGSKSGTLKVLAYDKTGATPAKKVRIAYLAECTDNPYCQARLKGIQAAAKKYGFDLKVFDAKFTPQTLSLIHI